MVVSAEGSVAAIPGSRSFAEAAPIYEGAHYALSDINAARMGERERILVNGGTGGHRIGRGPDHQESRGIYLSTELGPRSQNPLLALTTRWGRGPRVMFPIPKDDRTMAEEIASMVESGVYAPVIDRVYPLERIVEAYRYVETGQKIGNVVIDVSGHPSTGEVSTVTHSTD